MTNDDVFIKSLADRFRKENDLSDILYSLFNSSDNFVKLFNELYCEKARELNLPTYDLTNIRYAEREVNYSDFGRPDLKLNIGNENNILVEVKINDQDYHEEKYSQILNDKSNKISSVVLLTKVKLLNEQCPKWIKITWQELYEKLANSTDVLLNSISKFLKEVLNMNEVKTISFNESSISGLLYFNRMLLRSLDALASNNTLAKKYSSPVEDDGMGYYFEIQLTENNIIYPWFGLNFNEIHGVGIMIWIQKHSHPKNFSQIINSLKRQGKTTEDVGATSKFCLSKKEDDLVFMMEKSKFEETFLTSNSSISSDKQQEELNNFLLSFVNSMKECFV